MKRISKSFALFAIVAMGAISCNNSELDNVTPSIPEAEGESRVVLYASVGDSAITKVSYTENGELGIDLMWEVGDCFTAYNYPMEPSDDGSVPPTTRVGNFTCVEVDDAGVGKFIFDEGATLLEGSSFMATYPTMTTDDLMSSEFQDEVNNRVYNQNGDEISNIDNSCFMSSMFKYVEGEVIGYDLYSADLSLADDGMIGFMHQSAIMTFTFASEIRPAKLIFDNGGEDTYTVTYSTIEPDAETGLYTSHIAINSCYTSDRTLTFSLYATADALEPYDVRSVQTSKEYVEGMRYIAPISELTNSVWAGSGSIDDPYEISSKEDLVKLDAIVSSGITYSGTYFELTQSIDLEGVDGDGAGIAGAEFDPIGYNTNKFYGTLDGGNNKISNLYINNNSSYSFSGLFHSTIGATIKNLTIDGVVIGGEYTAAFVGSADSGTTLINCRNEATISGSKYVGGLVGHANGNMTFEDCVNSGDVTSSNGYTGGVAGRLYNGSTMRRSSNSGKIICTEDSGYTGGVTGEATVNSIVECSYNQGEVEGASYTGGLVGNINDESTVNRCYNTGDVTSKNGSVGGLVGRIFTRSKVFNSYSVCDVYCSSHFVGGLAGQAGLNSTIINCYSQGTVYGGGNNIGGFVGGLYSSATVNNGYTTSVVSAESTSERVGSFIGEDYSDDNAIVYGYYLKNSSGYSGVGTAVNDVTLDITEIDSDMLSSTTFVETLDANADAYNLLGNTVLAVGWITGPTLDL